MQLLAIIRKELQLLYRDLHGLLLLFVMPVIFILIMSLAMKADFDRRSGVQVDVLVENLTTSEISTEMLASLMENKQFNLINVAEMGSLPQGALKESVEQAVRNDRYSFLLRVPEQAFTNADEVVAEVLVAPGVSQEITQLFVAMLRQAVAQQKIRLLLESLEQSSPELEGANLLEKSGAMNSELVSVRSSYQSNEIAKIPTSVQQNVPAWLVFSMFFVVVPLANTLINERQLGTLRRIRTIPVASWKLIAGKIIPYFFINQIQVVLMLLVGVNVVPLLGGDQLTLGNSITGLLLMSSSLSVAALGYAMLVAVICRTTEQATTLGGAGNIILAALGGIMVPTVVMPEFMQTLTVVSPMSWGLQGFLDIFLRGGGVIEVMPKALSLVLLGMIMLSLAILLLRRDLK
ncbi:MAG TPA: ABC transporter permease [Porticoccus sp.]|nr:ABC transporter permease [Porticoccus sp.]